MMYVRMCVGKVRTVHGPYLPPYVSEDGMMGWGVVRSMFRGAASGCRRMLRVTTPTGHIHYLGTLVSQGKDLEHNHDLMDSSRGWTLLQAPDTGPHLQPEPKQGNRAQ